MCLGEAGTVLFTTDPSSPLPPPSSGFNIHVIFLDPIGNLGLKPLCGILSKLMPEPFKWIQTSTMIEKSSGTCITKKSGMIPPFHRLTKYKRKTDSESHNRLLFMSSTLAVFRGTQNNPWFSLFLIQIRWWSSFKYWDIKKMPYFVWGEAWEFQLKIDAFTFKCLPSQLAAARGPELWGKAWPSEESPGTPVSSFMTT